MSAVSPPPDTKVPEASLLLFVLSLHALCTLTKLTRYHLTRLGPIVRDGSEQPDGSLTVKP